MLYTFNHHLASLAVKLLLQVAVFRKKTDSGSSVGSSKTKEPWPMLNNGKTVSNGETVISTTELSSSPMADELLGSYDHLTTLSTDDSSNPRHGLVANMN